MGRPLKVAAGVAVGLLALAALAVGVLGSLGHAQLTRRLAVNPMPVPIPDDAAAVARGAHVVDFACTDCHGADLTGSVMFDTPGVGTVHAPNITGLARLFSGADLVRAIRHGVAPDGRRYALMPADALMYLSREDLGAVIAYLRTTARTGIDRPPLRLTWIGKTLLGAGLFGQVFPAAQVDHETPFPPMPDIGPNLETGEYLSRLCWGCHGRDLAGGRPVDPASPPAPSLAGMVRWSEDEFLTFARTGRTPAGRQVDSVFMSWRFFGKLDPGELRGLYLYLRTRPSGRTEPDA